MYKQVLIPDKKNHSIEMPEEFFGKKVEVTVTEIEKSVNEVHAIPPMAKIMQPEDLFMFFGASPEFPSIDEIRSKAWPSKW